MAARISARIPAEDAALVAALVVGERGGLSADEETRFRAAGVTHLLSVSGLHLAFAAGLLFALSRWLLRQCAPGLGRRRPRDRWAAALALPVVAAYAILTGAEVATVRAALVVGHAFVGVIAGRRARGWDALVFAALALTLPCPPACVDPSFQLSFVAAWATLVIARPIEAAGLRRLLRQAWRLVQASFAATIATAPITIWHFNQVAPVGIVSNVIAVPLTEAAIVPLGIVGSLVDLAVPSLGAPILTLAGALAALLRAFVAWTAAWAPVWIVASPSPWILVVALVGLWWIGRRVRRTLLVAAVLLLCVGGERLWLRTHPRFEVTFLDVGQGDASVLRLPGGEIVLIDGGPGTDAAILVPFLLRQGVSRIALVVLSHPHPDHAGGLAEVVRRFTVEEIWDNGAPSNDPTVRALLASAEARHVPVHRPADRVYGAVSIRVLAPLYDGRFGPDPLASENDNSIVLRVEYAGRALLFAGDIETEAERALVARSLTPVDVLKVPHHGSRTSSTEELLDALHPHIAVAQLAIDNRYRFPHPDVVARYRERGVQLLRNDLAGAVRIRIDADGALTVACARSSCGDDG
jgi:competence protein ComEC